MKNMHNPLHTLRYTAVSALLICVGLSGCQPAANPQSGQSSAVQSIAGSETDVLDIAAFEQMFLDDLDANLEKAQARQRALDKQLAQIQWEETPYIGGGMTWPMPENWIILSDFGERFDGNDFHTGIDIYGENDMSGDIVAANDGIVKYVHTAALPDEGYGQYVIIDHGGKTATIYAHCSEILISEGDTVERGQIIAKTGSPGVTSGAYLHFEVRENGEAKSPLEFSEA